MRPGGREEERAKGAPGRERGEWRCRAALLRPVSHAEARRSSPCWPRWICPSPRVRRGASFQWDDGGAHAYAGRLIMMFFLDNIWILEGLLSAVETALSVGCAPEGGLFKMEMERYFFHIIAESALESFDADWTGMWVFMRIVWQSDAACLRQGRFERRASGFVCRKVGPECVFSRASGLCPDARGRSSWLPTFPSGLLPPSAGLRRALPAPAQGPSALENPVCCRAYLATLHPRPSGLLSPSAGHGGRRPHPLKGHRPLRIPFAAAFRPKFRALPPTHKDGRRSEERRVGKECRSRWSPYH